MGIGTQQSTLQNSTRRYRLRDSLMSNATIAEHLGLSSSDGSTGFPSCLFYTPGVYRRVVSVVAIRTKTDELSIFHVYQNAQDKMVDIGDRILE